MDLLPSPFSSALIRLWNLPGLPAARPRWPSPPATTPTHSRAAVWAQDADVGGSGSGKASGTADCRAGTRTTTTGNVSAREAAAGQALQDGGSLQQRRAGEEAHGR